jgi:acetylornithine deacetylase/succinyl-diaminopimelate desuccinylase-like protein
MTAAPSSAEDEVVEICRDLVRIDSSNPTSNERKAAEYVAEKLAEVGLVPEIIESAPGRASVITRMEGEDPSREALLIHGHLDVVPADASEWSVDPFGGEIVDDMLWGRGTVDMKDMDAMILSIVRHRMRTGQKPPRDVVLAFLADEEAGGGKGAHWLVEKRPELFEGCTAAVSEVGGFSVTIAENQRLYLIQTAEKGMAWLKLTARGRAGHGSFINDDNAVTALAEAVTRIGRHTFPIQITPTVRHFLEELSDSLHVELDPDDIENTVSKLGSIARIIGATLRHTANPTMLEAGYKVNVIPRVASASIDGRFLPGLEEDFLAQLDELLGPDIQREFIHHDIAVETEWEGALVDAMSAAIKAEDPQGRPVPYTLSGGTDAKSFSLLGMKCYGFSPLRLPADLDFAGMFHGVDERVPLESLKFGARVLDRFLSDS